MEVSPESAARRRRYVRRVSSTAAKVTPQNLDLLRIVADYRIVSLPQLARRACPSEKSARRHMRELFDAGLVDIVPVPRVALSGWSDRNDATMLYGSAPNIYTLSRGGAALLADAGVSYPAKAAQAYGPRNSMFLAHELAVRDVRVWLELSAIEGGHSVVAWRDGRDARIDLGHREPPSVVAPDAWFTYNLGSAVLVGLVEVDRGTEWGSARWREKVTAYRRLFAGNRLREATGYVNARVLVFAPSRAALVRIAGLVREHAEPAVHARFWLADHSICACPGLAHPVWQRADGDAARPLIAYSASQRT